MPEAKKHTSKKSSKVKPSKTVIVTKSKVPVKNTLFPKKQKKVNDLLSKSSLLPS